MSKTVLLGLIKQLMFGVDTITGLWVYVILSVLFREPANLWFLLFAGFCAYLPDFDLVWFLASPPEIRKWGHWRLGLHHPLFLLPAVGVLTYVLASRFEQGHVSFLTTLALVCVVGHFIHDSVKGGIHLFSPFTRDGGISFKDPTRWRRFRVTRHGVEVVPQEEVMAIYVANARKTQGKREIASRIEHLTEAQLLAFFAGILGLIALVFWVGYRLPF